MGLFDPVLGLFGGTDGSDQTAESEDTERTADDDGTADDGPETKDVDEMTPADLREQAEAFAEKEGLDFSVASLAAVDEFAEEESGLVAAIDEENGGLADRVHGTFTVQTGSYLGEVLIAEHGGQWVEDDGWAVEVEDGAGGTEVAVFDTAARSFADDPVFAAIADKVAATIEESTGTETGDQGDDAADASDDAADAGDQDADGSPGTDDGDEVVPVEGPVDDRRESFVEEANELVDFWPEHELDFTPESLVRLDEFVDDQWEDDRFRDAEVVTDGEPRHMDDAVYTGLVNQLGAYFGEVLVRNYDAEWIHGESSGRATVEVYAGDDSATANVFHVAEECLTEEPTFALIHDTVVNALGPDAPEPILSTATS